MFSANFVKDAVERATKSAAQAVILVIGMAEGFNLFDLDVKVAIGAAGGAALLSVLTSVATKPVGDPDSPSAVPKS
jgi:hypothetical protein